MLTSHALAHWVHHWGYFALFIGYFAEGTGLPGPVEVLLVAAGFMIAAGRLSLLLVIVVATVANVLGNFVGYAVGLYGGRPFVERYGRYLGMPERGLEHAQTWFDRYGGLAVAISRVIGITRTPSIVAAGVLKLRIASYAFWSMVGDVLFVAFWAVVGTFFGRRWVAWKAHHPFFIYGFIAFVIFAMVMGMILSKKLITKITEGDRQKEPRGGV